MPSPCEGYEGEKLRPTSYSKLTTTYLEEDPAESEMSPPS
jgi:hypothetical protein